MAARTALLNARQAREAGHSPVQARWWTPQRQTAEDNLNLRCRGDLHFSSLTQPGAVPEAWLPLIWRMARWWQTGIADLRTLQVLLEAEKAAGDGRLPPAAAGQR